MVVVLSFFHIFVGQAGRHAVLLHVFLQRLHGVRDFDSKCIGTNISTHTGMPGVFKWVGHSHISVASACFHGTTLFSYFCFPSLVLAGWITLLCPMSRPASLVVFVMAIACT
jgi:hypothetical protein